MEKNSKSTTSETGPGVLTPQDQELLEDFSSRKDFSLLVSSIASSLDCGSCITMTSLSIRSDPDLPILPPPQGVVSQLDNPPSLRVSATAAILVSIILTTLIVSALVYTKVRIVRNFRLSDCRPVFKPNRYFADKLRCCSDRLGISYVSSSSNQN